MRQKSLKPQWQRDDEMEVWSALFIILVLALCAIGLSGCTFAKYGDACYLSVLQKKSLLMKPDGTLQYTTDSDAAIELARQNAALVDMLMKSQGVAP